MSDFSKLKTKKNGKEYVLNACTQDTEQNITGTKNFSKLTVNSKNAVTSINGISASEDGNVKLGTEKSTFNKVVYDTGYFSIDSAKTYNFDLTGSDLEHVPKDNVNIRLVAKVITAHNGFEVGDIAQLNTALDTLDNLTKVDICTYIRSNTLHVRSGGDKRFSIHNGTNGGWLEKSKAQIKVILTAFIPDDGSILLIAEDQTNTSKLIGLPDGTLTWKDKNIVRSVNNVTADEQGNVAITSIANATKATQDGAGNVITNTYVKKTGDETISGVKTFTGTINANGFIGFNSTVDGIGGGFANYLNNNKVCDVWGQPSVADKNSYIHLRIKDYGTDDNLAYLQIAGNNQTKQGSITFNGKNLVRSVNGANADAQGNVVIKDLVNIIKKNDGNDYYDDSDITSLIYAGNGAGTIRNEVANGNFARVHPGQTIKGKVTGTTYIVVGCNIYLRRGDTELTRNHIGLMPIQLVGNTGNLLWSGKQYQGANANNSAQGYAPWSSDNETEGKNQTSCYRDSYIAKTVLPKVDNLWLKPDFENQGISVLTFRNLDAMVFDTNAVCMSNPNWKGCPTNWWSDNPTGGWTSKRLVLPSEPEIYGHYAWANSSYESGSQYTQLPLFRHKEIAKVCPRADIWLKDSASASSACNVGANGRADFFRASMVLRVCPLFLIA